MQHRLGTLFLLISLLVALSVSSVWACGAADKQGTSEKACCSTSHQEAQAGSHCSEDADSCSKSHPGQTCPDDDGCGGCHCPGCGTVSGANTSLLLSEAFMPFPSPSTDDSAVRQAFYFADHLPEAVYLPIWQPPQLGV